jgi:hypothetical protein
MGVQQLKICQKSAAHRRKKKGKCDIVRKNTISHGKAISKTGQRQLV